MCEVPVFYATTEGHTRRIAQYVAHQLRQHGLDSEAIEITSDGWAYTAWDRLRGVVVGASLHIGKHQKQACTFARRFHRELSAVPSVFFSVSLAAASRNADEVAAASRLAEKFCVDADWRPSRIASVAGCLAYTRYNWLVRLFMRRIARKEGASTDTSRDHDYTDWRMIDQIAGDLASRIHANKMLAGDGPQVLRAAS
jgi:menaquinone-dependent protoporphyrinogen oxidase